MKDWEQIIELQKNFIGEILTFAEVGLPPAQFAPFKKLVLNSFHDKLKPELRRVLEQGNDRSQNIKP